MVIGARIISLPTNEVNILDLLTKLFIWAIKENIAQIRTLSKIARIMSTMIYSWMLL